MKNNKFIELAKKEVVKYHNFHQDPVICIDESHVYVVWLCKALKNHKALLGVAKPDGDMYYEATYNGDRGEMYFDAYKKENNVCIPINEETESKIVSEKACSENQRAVVADTEHHSPYQETASGMLSPDYKERFKAEYQQTKIRYEKLKAFCNRVEAALRTEHPDCKHIGMPKHDCPLDLLRDQQRAMGEYLHCLEIRAVIEDVDL